MASLSKGKYQARITSDPDDIRAAQRLRYKAFLNRGGAGLDADEFDGRCIHFLIEDCTKQRLVGCFRVLLLRSGAGIDQTYSAQFYDLSRLCRFSAPMAEVGRFCIDPDESAPDILRVAWGALTAFVDKHDVELLFGCSSFPGIDATIYAEAFAMLRQRHLAPECWSPTIKARTVFRFGGKLSGSDWDAKSAKMSMPPLLRTYLNMGGWVSDHAVVDHQMNTLHVFTGLEIGAIPAARKRLLRAVAQ